MRPAKPAVAAARAERWARERFGLVVEATGLPGEIDRNFLLTDEGGKRFVMKVAPAQSKQIQIEAQLAALQHLGRTDLRDYVPAVVADRAGGAVSRASDGAGGALLVRVLTYLAGEPVAHRGTASSELRHQIGHLLGRLDQSLSAFEHPGARRHLVWDLARVVELRPLCNLLANDLRPLVVAGLETFVREVQPHLHELRASVIHNDANDHNLLVSDDSDGTPRLSGIVDFGDMVHTVRVAEPAVACAYAMLRHNEPWTAALEIVAGYEETSPLDRLERTLLPKLVVARLCASLLLAADARESAPEDDYLRISEKPVADLLERLMTSEVPVPWVASLPRSRPADEIVAIRRRHLGKNLSISYRAPLKIVRGRGQYLYDARGHRYLDLVNNVCHVGHCHPRVVDAGQRQMGLLNTNSRYLYDAMAEYLVRLTTVLPEPLSVCFLTCTGTEANDLALRLARAHSGSREIIVLDHAYHGHSPSLIEISPYKCEGPGGEGLASHAHKVPCPDTYRGVHRGDDAAGRYAGEVADAIDRVNSRSRQVGAFMAETLVGCGGQIVPPTGFLEHAYSAVRDAGGVCIADEVQVGFGRVGTHMWAFEAHGVVPDVVTLGKPIGNGHPLAAVLTTPEIAASFDTGMEYFNTFGGNPVSCAIGLAVLEVIEEEGLQENALKMGERFLTGLQELARRHELIGDVRGQGLFLGVELVQDRERRSPAGAEAEEVIERMKDRGFLLSTDGPDHNVIKIKPPMVLDGSDVDVTLAALDEVLSRLQ